MYGGSGDDIHIVDHPADLVVELPGEGMDQVTSYLAEYTLPANVEILNLTYWCCNPPSSQNGKGNSLDNISIFLF